MDLIEATKKAILGILTESTNAKLDINKIAEFLKDEVKVLTTSEYTCGWYELDRDLAIFVGWTAGYDPNDEDYIHAKDDPTFVLAAKIASTHEYMKTDLDWLTQPYYEDGEVWDTEITLTETSNFKADADWFIKSYKGIRKALDNGELLLENKKQEARREPEINNKVAPRDRRPSFERGSPNYTSPDEVTYKYNLEYAHNAEPKRYRVRSRQQAQNRENVGKLDFAGTDDMMNFEKTGFADEYDMNKTSREYRDLKKHIKANQQVLDNHYKNPEKNPNLNVDGIKKDITNDKRRATRIYNKAMNKNIESKQLKTEATTNLDDMYDEYKEAYHKDLDIKTVPCVIARDKMLSGWGRAKNTTHYQMVLCADDIEANNIASNMKIKAKSDGLANIRVDFGIKIPRNGSVSYSVGRNARAWNMSDSWYKRYDRPAEKEEEARSHKEDNEKVAPRTSIEKEYMHNNANFGIYNDKDAKKFNQDSYKEPINAKRNKIRNYKDTGTITHTSYEKSPNKQTQLYKDLKDLGYIKSTKKVTEATLNLDDMYDEYKKAYNKDLDTKRVPCVIARDIMLSGWGGAEGKNHYQVVLCADTTEARNIEYNMRAKAKQEQLANVRTSIGIQLPRNASVAYTVGRYAPAWNMGDSWYESRFGKVEEGRYKLDVVKYNMLHDKFKNDKRSYDELSDVEKEELNTYRDLTKKVYNSTRDHKDIKAEEALTTNYGGQNLEKPVAQVKKDFQNLIDTYNAKVDKKVERNGAENEVEYINKTVSASGKKAFLIRFQLNEIGGLLTGGYEIIYRGTFIDLNTLDTKEYAYGRIEYKLNDKDELESPVQEYDTIEEFISKINNTNVDELLTEAINTQDIQSHTTAGDTDEERAYYGKNMTKRDKVRSLDQAKRNLDKVNNGDDKINARQVIDQVSYDNLPDADLQTYKYRKDMASIYSGEGPKYNKDLRIDGKSKLEPSERNEMVSMMWDNEADEVADKIRAKHIAKTTKREAIETQNIQSHTTAGDNEDERAYYGKNLTKRDKIRSLDQAKRNLDRANKGDERVQAKQVYDQVSYDNLPDSKLDAYKYNKDLAKKAKERGDDFWEKEHNDTAKSFAKDMKYRHMARQANKKQEARNPENDKVNAMIRTTLNGSTKYVKDLEDLGFVLDRYGSNGKVSSIHHKDNDEYLYRGKMMGLDKNADLYNYLTKKRPTDWDDRTNSGFEVQKNMSSEKDLADGGYSSNGFTSTVGKSIPKRFKTNKSSIVVTEPYGSKKVKQYKKINADIASKKADIKEIQDDVDGLYDDVSEKQNNIVNAQNDINQLEKDKQALLQKTEARSNKADNEKASPRDSYKTAIISDDTSFPENELDIDLGLNTKRNRVRSQKQADSNYEKAEKELNKGKNSDLSKVGHNTFTRMSYEVSPNEDLRIYKNMRDVAKAYRSRDNDDETANMYDDYADEMANKIRTKQSKQKTEALSRDDYIRIENEPRTENYKKGLKIRDEIVNAWKKR